YYGSPLLGGEAISLGPIPSGESWVRVELPASQVGLEGQNFGAIYFDLVDGEAWFDHIGTAATSNTCIPAAPSATIPSGDSVWINDTLPTGACCLGSASWDTSQKADGTQSLHLPKATGFHHIQLELATQTQHVNYG